MRARRGLAGLVTAGLLMGAAAPAFAGNIPAVPDRVGQPGLRTPTIEDKPAGAASVALSGVNWGLVSHPDQVAVVGATGDTYRTLADGSGRVAGMGSQLSPDGRYLAFGQGIADLRTGKVSTFKGLSGTAAQAWSPDGSLVAVTGKNSLFVYDRKSARAAKVATLDPARRMDGWTVAFAPDGKRLAYQSGDTITIAGLDGKVIDQFPLPAGDALAGKGAWSPDSSTLLIAAAAACSCGTTYHVRWTLTPVDAITGAMTGDSMSFAGLYAVRALGWTEDGLPVVAAYYPAAKVTKPAIMATAADRRALATLTPVGTVRVLRVERNNRATTLLSSDPKGAQSIDVADDLLQSGVSRSGNPPQWHSDEFVEPAVTMLVLIVIAAFLATGFYFYRRRRSSAR